MGTTKALVGGVPVNTLIGHLGMVNAYRKEKQESQYSKHVFKHLTENVGMANYISKQYLYFIKFFLIL